MRAREGHESTWEPAKYGKFGKQFRSDFKTTIQLFEMIEVKICRQKLSVIFNQIRLNEEMIPKYTYLKLHDHAAYQ